MSSIESGATSASSNTPRVPRRQGLIACARFAVNRRRHKKTQQRPTTKRSSECHTSVSSSGMIESAPLDTTPFDENSPNFYQHLLQRRSWHDVQRYLRTDRGLNQLQDEPLVLHNALKYHAPLRLVNSILNRKEACLYETDAAQRNLLHIAAMSWSSPELIEYIVQKRPRTIATEVDCDGRTPLHLLLASADDIQLIGDEDNIGPGTTSSRPSSSIVQYRKLSSQRSPSQSAIQMLVKAAPETLNLEDSDHMSPIEYAILSNDSIQLKTIQQMRRWSEKQWKKTNKSNNTPTMAGAGDDCDSSSSSSSGGSSLLLEIPMGSRRRRGEVVVGGEGERSSHHRPMQRRVSRNAITA